MVVIGNRYYQYLGLYCGPMCGANRCNIFEYGTWLLPGSNKSNQGLSILESQALPLIVFGRYPSEHMFTQIRFSFNSKKLVVPPARLFDLGDRCRAPSLD